MADKIQYLSNICAEKEYKEQMKTQSYPLNRTLALIHAFIKRSIMSLEEDQFNNTKMKVCFSNKIQAVLSLT